MSAGYTERQGVITANTTVYSEPTTSAARLLVMKPGESLQAVEVHGGGWLTAFFSKGGNQVQGYFQASNLALHGQDWRFARGAAIFDSVHARIAPSHSAESVGTLTEGGYMSFAYFNDSWVYYSFVDAEKPTWYYSPRSQMLLYDPPHQNMITRVTTKNTFPRAAPWTGSNIVATVPSGTTVYMHYFNAEWAVGTVTVNGESRRAYFDLSWF